uniref:Uncharacterized protein n=1 Tax=Schizaphis graminum TaxID=13262 RepID=A0A2S2P7P4_SCHGA
MCICVYVCVCVCVCVRYICIGNRVLIKIKRTANRSLTTDQSELYSWHTARTHANREPTYNIRNRMLLIIITIIITITIVIVVIDPAYTYRSSKTPQWHANLMNGRRKDAINHNIIYYVIY